MDAGISLQIYTVCIAFERTILSIFFCKIDGAPNEDIYYFEPNVGFFFQEAIGLPGFFFF